MKQSLALKIMLQGKNVLLTGAAGAGKTYCLNEFIKLAKERGKYVSVTASTGLAASHLNGMTIHSWAGIGTKAYSNEIKFENFSEARKQVISNTDILVIDEISMLHDYRLDLVDYVCRVVRKNDTPFGGIQVVLCGDFSQLPPVNRPSERSGKFVVYSNVIKEAKFVVCYLSEQHRSRDNNLIRILNNIRSNKITEEDIKSLESCFVEYIDEESEETYLHTNNANVDAINNAKLREIIEETISYQAKIIGDAYGGKILMNSISVPENLDLKIGALVMTVKNHKYGKYVNGSIGKIVGFSEESYPIVEFLNGNTLAIEPELWDLMDGENIRASVSQIPLKLAWAVTVHKSQGMTLDSATINLSNAFIEGMGYVALSRVKDLKSLKLLGLNDIALKVSDESQAIDEKLRAASKKNEEKFAYLNNQEIKPVKKRRIRKAKKAEKDLTPWQAKIQNEKKKHINAYERWNKLDLADLSTYFLNGMSVEELSKTFGRSEKEILFKLKELFGEDFVNY